MTPSSIRYWMDNAELTEKLSQLQARLEDAKRLPMYPPPGYQYPHAQIRSLLEEIDEVRALIEVKRQASICHK